MAVEKVEHDVLLWRGNHEFGLTSVHYLIEQWCTAAAAAAAVSVSAS